MEAFVVPGDPVELLDLHPSRIVAGLEDGRDLPLVGADLEEPAWQRMLDVNLQTSLLPQSAAVWELSRFAATDDEGGPGNAEWAVRPMLAAVVECAAQLGARQLIGVTFASI